MARLKLEALLDLREREERAAQMDLARAQRELSDARARLAVAAARAQVDGRRQGTAAEWQLDELAHERARADVALAEEAVRLAQECESRARTRLDETHRRAEAVRRAIERKKSLSALQASRAENHELDEAGRVRFTHKE